VEGGGLNIKNIPEWDYLRIALAINRTGSMQAAADHLTIDRSTVLRRLDTLEMQLGVRLFDRRSDGCITTEAGKDVIATAESIEQTMTSLTHRLAGGESREEGRVVVTVPEFFATKLLIPSLPRLRKSYPGIAVEVDSGHQFRNLARGEADIALRNRRPEQNALLSRKVGSVAIAFFASRTYLAQHGAPVDSFAGHDVIIFGEELRGMPGYQRMVELARNSNIVMRCNEIMPLLSAARADLGITAMPAIAAQGDEELVPVWPGIVGLPEIFLVTHRDLRQQARIRIVYEFIVKLCTENAGGLAGRTIEKLFPNDPANAAINYVSLPTP
jgi:DNA-binding transcriptional LysR family regulator